MHQNSACGKHDWQRGEGEHRTAQTGGTCNVIALDTYRGGSKPAPAGYLKLLSSEEKATVLSYPSHVLLLNFFSLPLTVSEKVSVVDLN
ncbi:hypothetical protein VNO80_15091 [Phaseolus coccineus]|uniref:Uncharacterized protein n=1 Tax=Phaseolus coccineus TaxID=3886 RepID=A0AAN9MJM2_PHACN